MPDAEVFTETVSVEKPQMSEDEEDQTLRTSERDNVNREILAMHREGMSDIDIARNLGMGVGEVRLIIGLYRGE